MIDFHKPYSAPEFENFLREFLPEDFEVRNEILPPEKYWKCVKEGRIIGSSKQLELHVLEFLHENDTDPRATLTKESFRILAETRYRKSLVIFRNRKNKRYRFSLIIIGLDVDDNNKITKKYSNAKRYSFLLGEGEPIKTAADQLIKKGRIKDFKDLESRFDVEVVRKQFFDDYFDLFIRLYMAISADQNFCDTLSRCGVDRVKFSKNLLGKMVFVYFIQKKGWLGVKKNEDWGSGDRKFLRTLWDRFSNNEDFVRPLTGFFYNDYLEHLFYNGFNKDRRDDDDYEPNMRFRVPYLNGGLFKEDYEGWETFTAEISNEIFSNEKKNGVLDYFDLYNFTVDEDDPLDAEIAVDPEMLGKIFEKMISVSKGNIDDIVSIYQEKGKAKIDMELNKKFGAFYTPREIVHYMCQESLVNYLTQSTNIDEDRIRDLIERKELANDWASKNYYDGYTPEQKSGIDRDIAVIDEKLQKIKVLDPAIGSGAFPMGLLHEISGVRWYFRHHEFIKDGKNLYNLKKETILECIYGVDIEPGAIDIARLRFWLSLIVDEENPEPLPNFEFKFVCANTLAPLSMEGIKNDILEQNDEANLDTLKKYKRDYYRASGKKEKDELKRKIRNYTNANQLSLISSITERSLQMQEFGVNFDNSNHSHSFFDPSLMLGEWRGFDVIIGNPPYSGISTNKGEWITSKIEDYKYIDGVHFGEKKHWLQDDYVKFFRFAESVIESSKKGMLSFITNHGFIDNPTFRGMRWHLLQTFDHVSIIDLHGNSKKKETTPDGGKDENVFDIQQGTAIFIGVKTGKKKIGELAKISHIDLYGKRTEKFDWLEKNNNTKLNSIDPITPYYFFAPKNFGGNEEYQNCFSISDLFTKNVTGIQTGNDDELIDESRDNLENRLSIQALKSIESKYVKSILYRPFDNRYTFYIEGLGKNPYENIKIPASYRPRYEIMRSFAVEGNLGLIIGRQGQVTGNEKWNLIYITNTISDLNIFYRGGGVNFPLYLYYDLEFSIRIPNLDPIIWSQINEIVGETTPEQIIDYIYAVLHSPNYREKYREFLKIDFPRVPYPTSKEQFLGLVKLGEELRGLHLLESNTVSVYITKFPEEGLNVVESPKYVEGKVYINKSQYFSGVPESVWNFPIGGYLPAQKWLKDRKGRILSTEDITHYQSMIVAMSETIGIMRGIDRILRLDG